MTSIYNCWNCNKNLLDREEEPEYFFWCDKKCHDAYERTFQKKGAVLTAWSNFMCQEGPCPKEMLEEAKERFQLDDRNYLVVGKALHKPVEESKLPQIKKTKPTKRRKTPTAKKGTKTVRRQYKCSKCNGLGHNSQTCEK